MAYSYWEKERDKLSGRSFMSGSSGYSYWDKERAKLGSASVAVLDEPMEARGVTGFLGDLGIDFMKGTVGLTQGMAWLADQVPGIDADWYLGEAEESQRVMGSWYSEKGKEARSQEFISDTPEGLALGDFGPEKIASSVIGNIPSFIYSVGGGQALVRGVGAIIRSGTARKILPMGVVGLQDDVARLQQLRASGVTLSGKLLRSERLLKLAEVAGGATGYGLGEATIAAGMAGLEMEDQIKRAPHDTLYRNSERYRQIYDSAEGVSEEERQAYAHETLGTEAGREVARRTGLYTFLTSAPAGAVLGRYTRGFTEPLKAGSRKGAVAIAAGTEAPQEFIQSGGEKYIQNMGIKTHIDPEIDDWQGVLNAAVEGGIVGGILGGGFGHLSFSPIEAEDPKLSKERESVENQQELGAAYQGAIKAGAAGLDVFKIHRYERQNREGILATAEKLRELATEGVLPADVATMVKRDYTDDGYLNDRAFLTDAVDDETEITYATVEEAIPHSLAWENNIVAYKIGDKLVVPVEKGNAELLTKTLKDAKVVFQGPFTATPAEIVLEPGTKPSQVLSQEGEAAAEDVAGPSGEGAVGPTAAIPTKEDVPTTTEEMPAPTEEAEPLKHYAEAVVWRDATQEAGKPLVVQELQVELGIDHSTAANLIDAMGRADSPARFNLGTAVAPARVPVGASAEQGDALIKEAGAQAAESPLNDLPAPTDGQKKKGNYAKGHVVLESEGTRNLAISIENPKGSTRRGKGWHRKMKHAYGYFTHARENDDGKIDVYLGKGASDESNPVFIVNQMNQDGSFDEHKVVMGYKTAARAKKAYLSEFPASMHETLWGGAARLDRTGLNEWLDKGDLTQPVGVVPTMMGNYPVEDRGDRVFVRGDAGAIRRTTGLGIPTEAEEGGVSVSGDRREDLQAALESGRSLDDIVLTEQVIEEETGEEVIIERQAQVALRQSQKRLNMLETLRGCIGA